MTQPWMPFRKENIDNIFKEMRESRAQGKPPNYLADKYSDNLEALMILRKLADLYLAALTKAIGDNLKKNIPQGDVFRDGLAKMELTMCDSIKNADGEVDKKSLNERLLSLANLLDRMSVDSEAKAFGSPELLEEANLCSSRLRKMSRELK